MSCVRCDMKWYSLQVPYSNLHLYQALRDVAVFKLLNSNIAG